ncbi:MAG: hypothetical protein GOVbin8074_21 [Prokaryotic dsDNA virus sp.]|nr:MAG: hypothetical protein GOVbin8074_21 [Prokaryotic dsDNA virus sp.]|tara:strand:+ start:16415 stop:16567 length:153 start_codon:yes stop_codon:yes gene_type:complete
MSIFFGIIVGFFVFAFIIISYLEYRADLHEMHKIKENLKKYEEQEKIKNT